MMLKNVKNIVAIAVAGTLSVLPVLAQAAEVNVYSARKENLIKPLLDRFTEQTGITVNLVTGKADALITRIKNEGEYSPADVLLTTDVGRLVRAKEQALTQSYASDVLHNAIPAHLRDAESHWYSMTLRARTIMYAPERVDASQLSTMEGLTDARWKGRICIRSSSNIYNQSMISAMLYQVGENATQEWAQGMVKNFARPPKGGDRDQIKAVVAGQCDIAIANTYYLAGMLTDTDENNRQIAEQIKVFWPNQEGRGAHVNVSGAALMKHAPNGDAAQKLLEFMVTPESQAWYAKTNGEYPVLDGVAWSEVLKGFGTFKGEDIPLEKVGELNGKAVQLMDKAGWK